MPWSLGLFTGLGLSSVLRPISRSVSWGYSCSQHRLHNQLGSRIYPRHFGYRLFTKGTLYGVVELLWEANGRWRGTGGLQTRNCHRLISWKDEGSS